MSNVIGSATDWKWRSYPALYNKQLLLAGSACVALLAKVIVARSRTASTLDRVQYSKRKDPNVRNSIGLLALALTLGSPGTLVAQAHSHDHASPYAGFTDREIKALSADEVAGLLNGDGLGMALPAELNRYPGPRHVLELGAMLGLSADQESQVQAIFDEMQAQAQSFGSMIVELERDLDRSFAEGTITEARLGELLEAVALNRARLRASHLRAHLRVLPVLTESQREHYERARGYAG